MGTTTGAEETMDDLLKQIEESRRRESLELYNDLTVLAEITGGDDLFYAAALEAKKSGLGEDKVKTAAKEAYEAQLLTASVAVMAGPDKTLSHAVRELYGNEMERIAWPEKTLFYAAFMPAHTASDFNLLKDEKLSIAESVGKKILETAEQYRQFKQVSHKR